MDEQLAKIVIAAGFGVGVLFRLAALVMYRKIAAAENPRRFESIVRGCQPAEAIDGLLQESQQFNPQARLERTAENRLAVSQAGISSRRSECLRIWSYAWSETSAKAFSITARKMLSLSPK